MNDTSLQLMAYNQWPSFRVENVFEKKMKKPSLTDRGMVTGRPGQKLDWKKMTQSVRQWYGHWRVNLKKNGYISISTIDQVVSFGRSSHIVCVYIYTVLISF